ncbi:LamG-like jellyroll fold domain-containing protein [Verrucomicrobiaceae bacterium 227]
MPVPLLYYPFDEAVNSTVVTDLSGNDYTGDVVGSVIFGVAGAPGGSTPAGAGQFSSNGTGIINVAGLDVPSILGKRDGTPEQGDLSYTMACWILPDAVSLTGDRFFFGQSVQGIHHGLRGNGRLHQAHWAADHYATTLLNSTDWVHATFTYDGLTDTATIYLNGTQDGAPVSKVGPNGSGNFIIGGRQGNVGGGVGEAHFVGLIDDVVVYQEVLTPTQIAYLAGGASPVDLTDTDNDGLPDDWEIANLGAGAENDNGSVNVDFGPAGDPDNDRSSNLEEFQRSTDPGDDDSDDDGLLDSVETDTGIWGGASDTGTDPNDLDSDNDGLSDGVENPDLAFVDENQTGSDPNLKDTDVDGFDDNIEVAAGTNPADPMSFPAPTDLPIIDDFEAAGLDGLTWLTNLNIPQGGAVAVQADGHVRIAGRAYLYTRDQYDPETLGGIYIKGQWTYNGGDDFLQILTRSDAVPAGDYGETQNGIEFIASQLGRTLNIRERGTELILGGSQRAGDILLSAGTTYDFVVTDDGDGALGFCMWEVGNESNIASVRNVVTTSNVSSNHVVFHNREGGRSSNFESVEIGVLADSDSDGMPDFWESDHGLTVGVNDGADDKDNDGLTNLEEYLICTDPDNEDTDGDGLKDGVESNTDSFVDSNDTGTDPLDPDSDNDGLGDSVENPNLPFTGIEQPGTDPNAADTDFDGTNDRVEIVKGSDPTDQNSLAPSGFPILYYSFEQGEGDVILDQTLNDFDGDVVDNVAFVSGAPGGSTPGFGIEFTTDANGQLDVSGLDMASMIRNVGGDANGSYTMSCWLKPGAGTAGAQGFIFGQTTEGIHLGVRNGGVLHSGHWAADWDATTPLSQDEWVHATWTYDGTTDTANIYLNGELDGGPTTQNPFNGAGNLVIGTRSSDTNVAVRYRGCLDEIAVWDEILPLETIEALAGGASPIGAPTGNGYLQITEYTFNQLTGEMSLTWNSRPGATYSINYDVDLDGFESDLNDGYDSQGATTTYTFNRVNLLGATTSPRVFFRVTEVE